MLGRDRETGVYRGFTDPSKFSRELRECEDYWNETDVKPGTFDQLLSSQLLLAVEQGRCMVNVLDLGSGSGALIKNVINDRPDEEKQRIAASRRILAQNPDLKVRIVGLTDARSDDEFLKREPIQPSQYSLPIPTNEQITAENVHYSITQSQTLGNFLTAVDLERTDLIISTAFFMYLDNIEVYKQTLTDAVKSLRAGGGKLLVCDYTAKTPAKIADSDYYNELTSKIDNSDDPATTSMTVILGLLVIGSALTQKRRELLDKLKKKPNISVQYDDDIVIIEKAS